MALGIQFTIAANLGTDPMTMFWTGISNLFSITIGESNILISLFLMIIAFFIDRKQLHIGSFINPIIIYITLEFFNFINFVSFSSMLRLILLIIGYSMLSFGIALYSKQECGKGAYEAFVFAISNKAHLSVGKVRTICDITLGFMGCILGAKFSIGTLIAILFIGSCVQYFLNLFSKMEGEC